MVDIVEEEEVFHIEGNKITQQFDGSGRHRLVMSHVASDWTGYCFISQLKYGGNEYRGTSEYYSGVLPRVFKVVI